MRNVQSSTRAAKKEVVTLGEEWHYWGRTVEWGLKDYAGECRGQQLSSGRALNLAFQANRKSMREEAGTVDWVAVSQRSSLSFIFLPCKLRW